MSQTAEEREKLLKMARRLVWNSGFANNRARGVGSPQAQHLC